MIKITPAVLDLLRERHIYSRRWSGTRWTVGQMLYLADDTALEPYVHIFGGMSLPREMDAFSYAQGGLTPDLTIGRYCSLADGLTVMGNSHPTEWAMTSPVFFDPKALAGVRSYLADERKRTRFPLRAHPTVGKPIRIGNDVWTGLGVTIKGGVTIGDGAVIGARAVVTQDVPPYAIVGGVPAKIIRMRFSDPVIERFMAVKPWRFGPDDLEPLGVNDPMTFLDRLEDRIAAGKISELTFEKLTHADLAAAAQIDA